MLPRTPRCLTLVWGGWWCQWQTLAQWGAQEGSGRKTGLPRAEHVLAMLLKVILTKGQT